MLVSLLLQNKEEVVTDVRKIISEQLGTELAEVRPADVTADR
jgi:acyl carrier protein